ncbi:MAG TPA: tail fiber protein [Acidimicrobiales bacterium]
MSEPFLGEIRLFPYTFAPRGWAFCQGQLLSIAQNTALFSLLGVTYGGNGQTTFGLPDLRGRVAMSSGQGPGLSNYVLGETGGEETVTLLQNQMPMHNHMVNASSQASSASRPSGQFPSAGGAYTGATDGSLMNPSMIGAAGGSQPHDNMQPYLTLNYCIALEGIYPSRN